MDASERRALYEHLKPWNPWWLGERPSTGVPREELRSLEPWIGSPRAIAVLGIRRAGKTTMLRQLVNHLLDVEGVAASDILLVNLEDPVFIGHQDDPAFLDDLLQTYREHARPAGTVHLFLDEIQRVAHWARWVRTAVDRGSPSIYLSGSSSRLLEPELASVLTGRHHQVILWPFSFRELCTARDLPRVPGTDQPRDAGEARALLLDYLQHGGLPEVVLAAEETVRQEIPKDLFRDILYRDIVSRHSVRSVGALEAVAQYLLTNTARFFTYNRLKERFGLGIDQVRSYMDYLEQSFLLYQLPRFDFKVARQARAPRKVYATDTGIRNGVSFRFSEDLGWLAESVVHRQLRQRAEGRLYYFLGKQECDFVRWREGASPELVQVSFPRDPVPDRERQALLEAMVALDAPEGWILTDRTEREEEVQGRMVRYEPLWRWLLRQEW